MKRISLLAVPTLALAVVSGTAMAAADVEFFGSVTDTTCDLVVHVDGAVKSLVQLGSVPPSQQGAVIPFSLKPNMSMPECLSLPDAAIAWAGPFNISGLGIQSGAATDAHTVIYSVNSTPPNTQINSGTLTTYFSGADLNAEGAQFTAMLQGGIEIGVYRSAAAFVVTYQ